MRKADEIWNRACSEAGAPARLLAPGDRALADMILAHSIAMNGGVLHAIESLTAHERDAAVRGYRYFALDSAANVLEDIAHRWGDGDLNLDDAEKLEFEADDRYLATVADDGVLMAAFETRLQSEPGAFDRIG